MNLVPAGFLRSRVLFAVCCTAGRGIAPEITRVLTSSRSGSGASGRRSGCNSSARRSPVRVVRGTTCAPRLQWSSGQSGIMSWRQASVRPWRSARVWQGTGTTSILPRLPCPPPCRGEHAGSRVDDRYLPSYGRGHASVHTAVSIGHDAP